MLPTIPRSRIGTAAAICLAAVTVYAGIHWGSTVGGGADSYGYVSQAGLLRQGRLTIEMELARPSPWPGAIETWAPLGYRPALDRRDAIVPLYPPGLPMLMAIAQAVGGFCAAFVVVPLCGGLVVLVTYQLGQRTYGDAVISTAAAMLVAASPIFLYQLMNPMTDVPVTAAWALATLLVAAEWPLAAGAAAAVAILIRPNLVPLVVILAGWTTFESGPRATIKFVLAVAPSIAIVAAFNTILYGAPWLAGYGAPEDLYAVRYARQNAGQFGRWLIETQTPIVALALIPLVLTRPSLPRRTRHLRILLGAMIAGVVLSYLFYLPFDAWWYLRFLLPMWPMMMVLVAAAPATLIPRRAVALTILAAGVAALAIRGVNLAARRSTFELAQGERRYIDVARFVRERTDANAVAIAAQHGGTLRLYAGRLTLRFDQLDPLWLDRVAAFLVENGRHPYIVLEGGEVEEFKRRFAASSEIGRLDWQPMATFASPYVAVYDALDRHASAEPLAIGAVAMRRAGWRCDLPYAWPPPLRVK
jgi:hypothetical protein